MMNVYVGLGAGRTLDGLRAISVYHQKQVISLSGGHPCFYILLCWGFSPDDAEADSIDFKLAPSKRLSHLQNVDVSNEVVFQNYSESYSSSYNCIFMVMMMIIIIVFLSAERVVAQYIRRGASARLRPQRPIVRTAHSLCTIVFF